LKQAVEDLKTRGTTVFFNHNIDRCVGKLVDAEVDDVGLLVKIYISQHEKELRDKIREGIINKFSIGGNVDKARPLAPEEVERLTGERVLKPVTLIEAMTLYEVSIVGLPANANAQFTLHKSLYEAVRKGGVEMKQKELKEKEAELQKEEEKQEEEVQKETAQQETAQPDSSTKEASEAEKAEEVNEDQVKELVDQVTEESEESESSSEKKEEEKPYYYYYGKETKELLEKIRKDIAGLDKKLDQVLAEVKKLSAKEAEPEAEKSETTSEETEKSVPIKNEDGLKVKQEQEESTPEEQFLKVLKKR